MSAAELRSALPSDLRRRTGGAIEKQSNTDQINAAIVELLGHTPEITWSADSNTRDAIKLGALTFSREEIKATLLHLISLVASEGFTKSHSGNGVRCLCGTWVRRGSAEHRKTHLHRRIHEMLR